MIHEMDIWHESFVKIKEQTKTIEMRLFDEKRSLISIGDTIIFTDTSNKEKIDCMVINKSERNAHVLFERNDRAVWCCCN